MVKKRDTEKEKKIERGPKSEEKKEDKDILFKKFVLNHVPLGDWHMVIDIFVE